MSELSRELNHELLCLLQTCISGWSLVHGSCRRLILGSVNQHTAQANCLAIGGHLTLVSSAEDLGAVQAFIQSEGLGPTNGVWVDGSDAEQEGVWRAFTGENMTYLGWTSPEPNGGTNENCMTLRGANVRDDGCSRTDKSHAALCEL